MGEQVKDSKIVAYWKENIATNYKKISAILGSMLIMIIGLLLYGFKIGLDIYTVLMTIVFAINPFLTILINIMFKGESEIKDRDIALLTKELEYQRDISEWQLQVVALKASADWNKYNELLKGVVEPEKIEP